MKTTMIHIVAAASGKLCNRENQYFFTNKRTGKVYCATYHPREMSETENTLAAKKTFANRSKLASAWWKANKPKSEKEQGTEAYIALMKAYKAQHDVGNPFAFLRTLITPDMKVILSGMDITGDVTLPSEGTQTPPSQGGGDFEG